MDREELLLVAQDGKCVAVVERDGEGVACSCLRVRTRSIAPQGQLLRPLQLGRGRWAHERAEIRQHESGLEERPSLCGRSQRRSRGCSELRHQAASERDALALRGLQLKLCQRLRHLHDPNDDP